MYPNIYWISVDVKRLNYYLYVRRRWHKLRLDSTVTNHWFHFIVLYKFRLEMEISISNAVVHAARAINCRSVAAVRLYEVRVLWFSRCNTTPANITRAPVVYHAPVPMQHANDTFVLWHLVLRTRSTPPYPHHRHCFVLSTNGTSCFLTAPDIPSNTCRVVICKDLTAVVSHTVRNAAISSATYYDPVT